MIFFFIFILTLSIYEIYNIVKKEDNKKSLITAYSLFAIITIAAAIFYYTNQYDKSIAYYIFQLLNIKY